ncbi:MAG: CoA transferase [SAR202 cluster bacterium]|nr:CoA transferase [SAR202 cluster bacterium]MDP6714773.1 CoA transferase [SAR202 cluster bacterium]
MNAAALDGLKVVELAEGVAGPYCGRLLAAFGAEVVKIERPQVGDWTRGAEPLLPDVDEPESSALFLYLNTGKKSVTLDWHNAANRSALGGLLESADILVDSSPPGTLDNLGLGFDRLHEKYPNLISVSITDFGLSGPYRDWKSTPLVNLALGGYLYLSGDENREPLMLPGYQADYLAGLHGYIGATTAIWSRDDTGEGQQVEVAVIEALAALHQFTTVMHTYGNMVRSRHGNRWEALGVYGRYPITVLPCKDGHVSFAVSIEHQWENMCALIGRQDMLDDPRFATFPDRRQNAQEIDDALIDWMKDKTKEEIFREAAGIWSIPVAPVSELDEVMNDIQYKDRGLWTTIDHPVAGQLTYPTFPVQMTETQPTFERAPILGEHNNQYLCLDRQAQR